MADTGMGSDAPATATRSSRRTRRLAIVGALALVLVAGAVLVGVKTTGARSGYIAGAACKDGGTCVLGDVGPGLGTVFYVAATSFACGTTAVCSYLEAAPAGWKTDVATDPQLRWNLGTNSGGSDSAQNVSSFYSGGGKGGWHLPSRGELHALYNQRALPGVGLQPYQYWSNSAGTNGNAQYIVVSSGTWVQTDPTQQYYVRPVRAF